MDTDQLIRIHSFAFSLRSCQNLAIFAQHYRVKQFNLIVCVELLFFMCAQPQIRLRIAYLRNCLDPKTQLNYFLCVLKRNKNSWYSIPNFFIAYDALRLPFFIPRRSRRDIVLASSVRPSIPSVRPSALFVCPEPYLSIYWSDLIHSWYKW